MLISTKLSQLVRVIRTPCARTSPPGLETKASRPRTLGRFEGRSYTSHLQKTVYSRYFSCSARANSQPAHGGTGFGGSDEYQRLAGSNRALIDENGNYTAPGGVAMSTQSSGGLTKRNNTDIGSLDIFEESGAVVTAYSETGFVINEEYTEGSILCFPERFWSWNVSSLEEITIETLSPIWLRNPVPKILVLGTGATLVRPSPELQKFLLVRGISTEVSSTANAISTFNFLVQEDRSVVGAFLPAGQRSESSQ